MAQVTLPNTITAGETATAAQVQANFEALVDGVNNVESDQIGVGEVNAGHLADGAVTAAKIATGAIENAKIASGAITNEKIGDAEIEATKLAATIVLMSHQGTGFTSIANGASANWDFTDVGNETVWPVVSVFHEFAGAYMLVGGYDSAGALPDIRVTCAWWGETFRVTVTNQATTRNFRVIVAGVAT